MSEAERGTRSLSLVVSGAAAVHERRDARCDPAKAN